MLKHVVLGLGRFDSIAAAFGRLCVETNINQLVDKLSVAAAFGRLCVETALTSNYRNALLAAAFGRLCVETCSNNYLAHHLQQQPPSGGCVLKQQFLRLNH